MNVPKLRFKEFNDEWSFTELAKISSDISYGMGLASKEYDGVNKYIRITDIDEKTNKYSNKDIVSPDGVLEDKYLVNKNDILFARTGASTGKTYLYDEKDGKNKNYHCRCFACCSSSHSNSLWNNGQT